MEILLWFIIPLLILTFVLISWLGPMDEWCEPLIYLLAQVARARQYTAGLQDRHGLVVRLLNRTNSGSTSGNAELTAGHWTLSG